MSKVRVMTGGPGVGKNHIVIAYGANDPMLKSAQFALLASFLD